MISFILVRLTISTDFYRGWWSAFSIFKPKIIIQWSSMVVNLHRRRVRLWKQREVLLSQRSLLWSRHGNTRTPRNVEICRSGEMLRAQAREGSWSVCRKYFNWLQPRYFIKYTIQYERVRFIFLTLFCYPYFSFANCLESDQGPHQYLQYLRLHHRHNQCHQLLISAITNICPLGNHTGVWLWFNISVNHCH